MSEIPSKDNRTLNADEQRIVLDVALKMLSEGGLQATFTEKVAEKCGIPAPRIYVHFGGTERLIQALLERELELIAGSVPLPELRFPGETLRDELEGLARILLDECRAHIGFLRTMLAEAMRNPDFASVFYRTFILRGRKLFTEFLETRKQRGELRSDIDVEAAAAFFLSALTFSLLLMELFGGKSVESVDDDRLVKSMSQLFLTGALRLPENNSRIST
ncbi:MAG TPA: TetR/AcrR family transcriptional regulator C-terminal domain-containing protein [Acidobacteriota bacterium]|jgi:AcrR family transcriptional regulator|nr:TetR/AcrR family transcriptional regulator C-terminal domain-containing protein [Acidobacteriota bacterium]